MNELILIRALHSEALVENSDKAAADQSKGKWALNHQYFSDWFSCMGRSSKTFALYSGVLRNMEMPSAQVSSDLYSVGTHTLQ